MAGNERFIRDLFNDIAADGFEKKFEDALHEDLVWVATGSSPVSGEYKGKQVYLEKIIRRLHDRLQSWPKAVVENILVDGDTACVQFHGEGGVGKKRSELRYAVLLGDENPEPENRARHRVLRFREDDCSSPELSGCLARNHRLESDQFNIGIHRTPLRVVVQPNPGDCCDRRRGIAPPGSWLALGCDSPSNISLS